MIKLAVCDDDPAAAKQIEDTVLKDERVRRTPLTAETYTSPTALLDEVTDGRSFDIFILDVEMPEMSGLDLAERIRRSLPGAAIIFLTSHTELHLAQESFKVGAIRYVSKLNMETALPEALEAAVRACAAAAPVYYTLTYYSDVIRLPVDEIVSVRRVARSLEVTTVKHGALTESRGLKEMLDDLNDERFLMIDRGCFVNLDHVTRLTKTDVILSNGERLPVSRRMMPQIKSAILRIWGEST